MEELKQLTNELKQFCANNKVDTAKVGLLMGLFVKHTKAMEQVKNPIDLGSVSGKKYLIDYKDFDGTTHHVVVKGKTEEEAREAFQTDYPLSIIQIREIGYR